MTTCNREGCNSTDTEQVETWVGSVPIYYDVCKEHKKELEELDRKG